jgi:hypothetical protein
MPQILEVAKTNAKDAALVAVGVPVVLFDRVSDRLNARLHLDSYVGLAREHGQRALDGYGKQLHDVTTRVRSMMPRPAPRSEGPLGPAPLAASVAPASAPEPPAKAAANARTSSTAAKKRAPRAKSSR